MKKLYEIPAIELTKFDVEDVITASYMDATRVEEYKQLVGEDIAVAAWQSSWDTTVGI